MLDYTVFKLKKKSTLWKERQVELEDIWESAMHFGQNKTMDH